MYSRNLSTNDKLLWNDVTSVTFYLKKEKASPAFVIRSRTGQKANAELPLLGLNNKRYISLIILEITSFVEKTSP